MDLFSIVNDNEKMILFNEIEGKPDQQKLAEIKAFYQSIFERIDDGKFDKRIESAVNLFTILAFSDDEIVGFKLGYEIDATKFYSWIGGVNPAYRKQGIADELMKRQHLWCQKKGFQIVQTKTKNTYKPMLILNIKSGFEIVELQRNERDELKIVLEKNL